MYWQYTTALASFVLTATNPEIRTDAVSTNVSFVFIVIPPIYLLAMMGGYGCAKTPAMRMLPKGYADTAKMRSPSRGSVACRRWRTLLMPHQGL